MSGVNFESYAPYLKTDYVAKALDTLIYDDDFLKSISRFPITQRVFGNKTRIPFDIRRLSSQSSTFIDAQNLSKNQPTADIGNVWEANIVNIHSVARISEKALLSAQGDKGAVFGAIVNAGNKCLNGLKLRLLCDLFAPRPGQAGVVSASAGKNVTLKSPEMISNFDANDEIEFRTTAGVKKGTGYSKVSSISISSTKVELILAENAPTLADGDIIYRRGDYNKPHIASVLNWYPKNITSTNKSLFGVDRGTNRSTLKARRLLGHYFTMGASDKFYDVLLDACSSINAISKRYPTICVLHPLTHSVVIKDMLADKRRSWVDSSKQTPSFKVTPFCPVGRMFLLDEKCIGFHFLPSIWKKKSLDLESVEPQLLMEWQFDGVEEYNKNGVNLVDFDYDKSGGFFHESFDDLGIEFRASFFGNFVVKAPGTGAVIELHSSKVPQFKN